MSDINARALDRELKRGSAELLILSLLDARPRHGYDLSKLIELRSGGQLKFHIDSLYPLLYRLEERLLGGRSEVFERQHHDSPVPAVALADPRRIRQTRMTADAAITSRTAIPVQNTRHERVVTAGCSARFDIASSTNATSRPDWNVRRDFSPSSPSIAGLTAKTATRAKRL